MVKYIIATHGNLAQGYKDCIGIIFGEEIAKNIITINAFTQDINLKLAIEKVFKGLNNDIALVFTDWFNGSVNQGFFPYISKNGTAYVVTGINLPLLCEIIGSFDTDSDEVDEAALRAAVLNAKDELKYVNDILLQDIPDDNKQETFFDEN